MGRRRGYLEPPDLRTCWELQRTPPGHPFDHLASNCEGSVVESAPASLCWNWLHLGGLRWGCQEGPRQEAGRFSLWFLSPFSTPPPYGCCRSQGQSWAGTPSLSSAGGGLDVGRAHCRAAAYKSAGTVSTGLARGRLFFINFFVFLNHVCNFLINVVGNQ